MATPPSGGAPGSAIDRGAGRAAGVFTAGADHAVPHASVVTRPSPMRTSRLIMIATFLRDATTPANWWQNLKRMGTTNGSDRGRLRGIARRAMTEAGLEPDFSNAAQGEAAAITAPARDPGLRDERALLWFSIDNDDSRDLDQLSVAEALPQGAVRV